MTDAKSGPGRIAVVTGGGRGIGRAVAESLSADGWTVVVCGRTAADLDATVGSLSGEGLAVVADVSDADDVERLFSAIHDRYGRIDLLFNNAGIAAPPVPIDELPVEAWDRLMAVNLRGSFLCARAAFGRMRRQDPPGGRIINNGSVSATTPRPFSGPYTASKHAITGLTRSLALDGRDLGITCGQIDIGNAASEMVERIATGALQPDGSVRAEATMGLGNVGAAVVHMASLPPDANVLSMTVMANRMPFVGRG
ncbi:MAG: 3-oxoacyl-ACP reductase [Acidimicrobiaceae bacterium]|nr:3-oxoacyl-ACP reductase [Acidimicrobiaceae bacterium]|tara:strand:- start:132 stop:893 length:762 start_codon:yes stop_codon:yes gene_type:complete